MQGTTNSLNVSAATATIAFERLRQILREKIMPSTHDYLNDKRNENIQVYVNGEFYHRTKANISVMDSGFLLGDGVWEGIRLYKKL